MNATEARSASSAKPQNVYNSVFWLAYLANVSLMTANALTFRFAELVAYLGGSEKTAGTIVSVGVIGALLTRLQLGQAIDRFGTRRLWVLSSLLFLSGCGMFLVCRHLSWELYAARIAFAAGLAGMFTCSIVHIQNQVPFHRRTELIGSLGSSGFIGMMLGTLAGDAIFHALPEGSARFTALFGGALGLGVVYVGIVACLTRHDVHVPPVQMPPAFKLLLQHWPGYVVLAALMMGVGVTVTTVFLTRFSTYLQSAGHGIQGIGTFFTIYASSAFVFRILTRQWSRTVGRHRMILSGLVGQALGYCLLPFVASDWHFILPAICCGWGHALLFPAVVSLGSGAFPDEYRGIGTTLMLGFTEIGAMLSAPLLGAIIDYWSAHDGGGTGFAVMFYSSAGMAFATAIIYALTSGRTPDDDGAGRVVNLVRSDGLPETVADSIDKCHQCQKP